MWKGTGVVTIAGTHQSHREHQDEGLPRFQAFLSPVWLLLGLAHFLGGPWGEFSCLDNLNGRGKQLPS